MDERVYGGGNCPLSYCWRCHLQLPRGPSAIPTPLSSVASNCIARDRGEALRRPLARGTLRRPPCLRLATMARLPDPARSDRSLAAFPSTRRSLVSAVRRDDPDLRRAGFEALLAVYWRPVYTRLRLRWGAQPADAEDLTQEFFARAIERDFFSEYNPARARFRTYVRLCLDRFVANARRADGRIKRGGAATVLSLDVVRVERELSRVSAAFDESDAEMWFDREWVRSLFEASVEALRSETSGTAREVRFRILARHDLEPTHDENRPSYRAIAEEFGLPVTQVTNHLAWARRELRRHVHERLELLSGSDAEVREEAARLFRRTS